MVLTLGLERRALAEESPALQGALRGPRCGRERGGATQDGTPLCDYRRSVNIFAAGRPIAAGRKPRKARATRRFEATDRFPPPTDLLRTTA
jgi:hypothetical protein